MWMHVYSKTLLQQLLIEMHECPCNFAISVFKLNLCTYYERLRFAGRPALFPGTQKKFHFTEHLGTRLHRNHINNNTGIVQCCRGVIIEPIAGLKVLFLDWARPAWCCQKKITRTCDCNLTGLKILTEHLCTQIQQLSIVIVTELFQTAQHWIVLFQHTRGYVLLFGEQKVPVPVETTLQVYFCNWSKTGRTRRIRWLLAWRLLPW